MDWLSVDWLLVALLTVIAFVTVWSVRKRRRLIREWAEARNLVLVKRLPSWFRLSPWPIAAPAAHVHVQYWLVRDDLGSEHRVWLKFGDVVIGMLNDEIVEWWES